MPCRVGGSVSGWAGGTLPFLRTIAAWDPTHPAATLLPSKWWRMWNGQLHEERAQPAAGDQGRDQGQGPGAAGENADELEEEIEDD